METDEIVRMTCHRLATDDEVRVAEIVKMHYSTRTGQSRPSSERSSEMATPRGIQIQDPQMQSRATGSGQTRPSSGVRGFSRRDTEVSEYCTSQYRFFVFWI